MEKNILAKVGNVEITDEVVDRTIETLRPEQQQFFRTEEGRKQLIDQLVNIELINAHGETLGVKDTDFYRTSMERAQKDIMLNATMNKVMEDVAVSDEELDKELSNENSEFRGNETIGAKHILVDTEEKARQIKEEIESGKKSFEDAAMEYSSCPSSQNGGDLGTFNKGMMVPEFEEASLKAEIGKTTEPVQTQFGYHLINVYQRGMDKEAVRAQMLQKKQMDVYNNLVNDLREKNGFK